MRLLHVFSVTLWFCFLVGDIMVRRVNNVIMIHAPRVYDAQADELYEIRQRVYNNWEFLQIPVTTWFNIRKYKLNRKRTRRGTRGGKPKQKNYGVNIENLLKIETDKERPVKSFERKLKISTVNVRSIQNKHLLFLDHLISNKIDICVVTEVWLNNLNPIVIADLNDQGYVFKPTVRQQRGGGIAISSRKNINITEVDKSLLLNL